MRKLTYHWEGEYLYPDYEEEEEIGETNKETEVEENEEEEEEEDNSLGKYGWMRMKFLQENRKAEYQELLMSGELYQHCLTVEKQAKDKVLFLMDEMVKKEGVTQELKRKDLLGWVGAMNNIKYRAEEIVLNEMVYI